MARASMAERSVRPEARADSMIWRTAVEGTAAAVTMEGFLKSSWFGARTEAEQGLFDEVMQARAIGFAVLYQLAKEAWFPEALDVGGHAGDGFFARVRLP